MRERLITNPLVRFGIFVKANVVDRLQFGVKIERMRGKRNRE